MSTISNRKILNTLLVASVICIFCHNIFLDRICVLLITIVCILLGKREKNLINPYYLFTITPISLLIYFNIGDLYMMEINHQTWLLGIINMVSFLFALNYTRNFKNIRNCIGLKSDGQLRAAIFIFLILCVIGRFVDFLQSIFWVLFVPAVVCAFKSKNKFNIFVVLLYLVFTMLGQISKTTVLTYSMAIIICYDKYYVTTAAQRLRARLLVVLGVIFMVFAFSFANSDRGSYNADEGLSNYTKQGVEWNYNASFFMPYMYITNGWTNLQYVQQTQDTRTYGLWLMKPFLGYAGIVNNETKVYELESYSSFNTMTFIACGFKDFGYWLSIISSLFLGVFVKKIYSRYCLSRSPLDTASYVLVALATLEMFFSNHFFMQSYPFTIVIEMEVIKVLINRKKNIEIENIR